MLSKANLWTNRKELWTDRKTTGTIMGASALANIDKGLHHLFLSQIETLGMEPVARRSGIVSQLAPERGRGSAWMAGIGPDCLMTVLDLEVEGAVDLTSCGPGYFCLGIMSPSCLETMPRPVSAPGPAGLVMYCQDAGSYAYRLKPRTPYVSRSLCFTPRFWEQLAFDRRSDGDALLERFATAPQVLNAPHVGAMLQRLDARTADAAATELHLTALAAEADVFMVVGTSLAVYPAASLVRCIRPEVPVYVVDPGRPAIRGIRNPLEVIRKHAAEGVPELAERLREAYCEPA